MYVQKLTVPTHNLYPSNATSIAHLFAPHSPPYQPKKSSRLPSLTCEFCGSAKRVSESQTRKRNNYGLITVRCGGVSDCNADDGYYMRRCVELAKKAVGYTSPNPMVGCLIVKDGKVVGEGFHPKAGQPHAEVFALRDAGDLAENGTAYVTLEPCNHYGRTPPCTEALIKAKVKKVVIGMVDPNPIVHSKGIEKLRNAGIEVTVGIEEELCKKLDEAFVHQMLTERPFVTVRYSISVNGHLLDKLGEEVMESGGYYSKLLQEYDAVILSSTSITHQSSFPTSKEPGANQPLRIVLAESLNSNVRVPEVTADDRVIIFAENEMPLESEGTEKGIETVTVDRTSLIAILEHCKRQGLCSVLLDLRGNFVNFEEILREGFEQNLFQKVVVEVLPIWGEHEELGLKNLKQKLKLKNLTSRIAGKSVLLEGYF